MDNGEDCEFLCKEFKFGTSSEMFIGKLSQYFKFLNKIKWILKKYGSGIELEDKNPSNELFIEEINYPEEFFMDTEFNLNLD